jgi:sugar/nucleoside kinase (ribokinase family)
MALAATAVENGVIALNVTLGKRGVVYFAAGGFERLSEMESARVSAHSAPIRTALVPAAETRGGEGDPTGCGDVWGATYFSRLLAGDSIARAMEAAVVAAARNVDHRGATGLAQYLRGEISV